MPCCEISDCAQISKIIIAVRHFGLGGRESLETAVMFCSLFFQINVDHFMEILESFKPDIAQSLCDTVPNSQTNKRNRKSVDRTLKFLDKLLESRKHNDVLKSIEILGSIEGGDSNVERTRSAVETCKREVSGKTNVTQLRKIRNEFPVLFNRQNRARSNCFDTLHLALLINILNLIFKGFVVEGVETSLPNWEKLLETSIVSFNIQYQHVITRHEHGA